MTEPYLLFSAVTNLSTPMVRITMTRIKPVILGLGNPLFQDEGLGIHVIHQLMREEISQRADLIDGGTDALPLLGIVEDATELLIVDAINGNCLPGAIQRLEGSEIPLYLVGKPFSAPDRFSASLDLSQAAGTLACPSGADRRAATVSELRHRVNLQGSPGLTTGPGVDL